MDYNKKIYHRIIAFILAILIAMPTQALAGVADRFSIKKAQAEVRPEIITDSDGDFKLESNPKSSKTEIIIPEKVEKELPNRQVKKSSNIVSVDAVSTATLISDDKIKNFNIKVESNIDYDLKKINWIITVENLVDTEIKKDDERTLDSTFLINTLSGLSNLKIEKLSDETGKRVGYKKKTSRDNKEDLTFESMGIKTKIPMTLKYNVSADIDNPTRDKTYSLDFDVKVKDNFSFSKRYSINGQGELVRLNMKSNPIQTYNDGEKTIFTDFVLAQSEDDYEYVKGEDEKTEIIIEENPKPKKTDKFEYEIALDETSKNKDTKITIDVYESTEEGYVKKDRKEQIYVEKAPEKIEIDLKEGQIAKITTESLKKEEIKPELVIEPTPATTTPIIVEEAKPEVVNPTSEIAIEQAPVVAPYIIEETSPEITLDAPTEATEKAPEIVVEPKKEAKKRPAIVIDENSFKTDVKLEAPKTKLTFDAIEGTKEDRKIDLESRREILESKKAQLETEKQKAKTNIILDTNKAAEKPVFKLDKTNPNILEEIESVEITEKDLDRVIEELEIEKGADLSAREILTSSIEDGKVNSDELEIALRELILRKELSTEEIQLAIDELSNEYDLNKSELKEILRLVADKVENKNEVIIETLSENGVAVDTLEADDAPTQKEVIELLKENGKTDAEAKEIATGLFEKTGYELNPEKILRDKLASGELTAEELQSRIDEIVQEYGIDKTEVERILDSLNIEEDKKEELAKDIIELHERESDLEDIEALKSKLVTTLTTYAVTEDQVAEIAEAVFKEATTKGELFDALETTLPGYEFSTTDIDRIKENLFADRVVSAQELKLKETITPYQVTQDQVEEIGFKIFTNPNLTDIERKDLIRSILPEYNFGSEDIEKIIVEVFGEEDEKSPELQLKELLEDETLTYEKLQEFMVVLKVKYSLTDADIDRIYEFNRAEIEAFIEKIESENLQGMILAVIEPGAEYILSGSFPVTNNKLYIGQDTPVGTKVEIKHSDYLVKSSTDIAPIRSKLGNIIATGSYDPNNKTITYTITDGIKSVTNYEIVTFKEKFNLTNNLEDGKEYIISNTMTINPIGGVSRSVEMPPNKIKYDKNLEKYSPADPKSYNFDPNGMYFIKINPTYETILNDDGEVIELDWTVTLDGTNTLPKEVNDLSELGLILNLTSVSGSGIKSIKDITVNDQPINQNELTSNDISDAHINFSYNYKPVNNEGRRKYEIKFKTPINYDNKTNVLDLTYDLSNLNNYNGGALRVGSNATSDYTKAGDISKLFNNSRLVSGRYVRDDGQAGDPDKVQWIISDEINSNKKDTSLPLYDLKINNELVVRPDGNENKIRATYYKKDIDGKMIKVGENYFNEFPSKGSDLKGTNSPGTIIVYDFFTEIPKYNAPSVETNGETVKLRSLSQDITVRTEWTRISVGEEIPAHEAKFISDTGKEYKVIIPKIENNENSAETTVSIPVWKLDKNGNLVRIGYEFIQDLPKDSSKDTSSGLETIYYEENNKRFDPYIRFLFRNTVGKKVNNKPVEPKPNDELKDELLVPRDITIKKVDKETKKPLSGVEFSIEKTGDRSSTQTGITNDNGEVTFINLNAGSPGSKATYTIKETKAQAGYKLNSAPDDITIDSSGYISWNSKGNIINESTKPTYKNLYDFYRTKTYVEESKTFRDNTKDPINNKLVAFGNFNNSEQAKNELTYYVLLSRDQNHNNRDSSLNLVVKNGTISSIRVAHFNNDALMNKLNDGTLTRTEFDSLPEAASSLINKTEATIDSADKTKGTINIDNTNFKDNPKMLVRIDVNIDDYNLTRPNSMDIEWKDKESHLASSKVLTPELKEYEIPKSPQVLTITNEKSPESYIELTKTDDELNRLPGATFKITQIEDGVYESVKTTGIQGALEFRNLRPGKYKVEEISAPDGYMISGNYYEVTVNNDNSITFSEFKSDGTIVRKDQEGKRGIPEISDKSLLENGVTVVGDPILKTAMFTLDGDGNGVTLPENGNNIFDTHGSEGLAYQAKFRFHNTKEGETFTIKYDNKLDIDFTVGEFPDIVDEYGEIIAKAGNKDLKSNSVTYTMTNYLQDKGYEYAEGSIEIRGIALNRQHEEFKYITYTDPLQNLDGKSQKLHQYTVNIPITYKDIDGNEKNIYSEVIRPDTINFGNFNHYNWHPGYIIGFSNKFTDSNGDTIVRYQAYYNDNNKDDIDGNIRLDFDWFNDTMELKNLKVYNIPGNRGNNAYAMPLSYGADFEVDEYLASNGYTYKYSDTRIIHQDFNGNEYNGSGGGVTYTFNPNQPNPRYQDLNGYILNPRLSFTIPSLEGNGNGKIFQFDFKVRDPEHYYNTPFAMDMGYVLPGEARGTHAHSFIGERNNGEGIGHAIKNPTVESADINFINKKNKGKITINKTDSEGLPLAGAVFIIKDEDGNTIQNIVTNDNGRIESDELSQGKYILEEIKAPEGYSLGEKSIWNILINSDGTVKIDDENSTELGPSNTIIGYDKNYRITNPTFIYNLTDNSNNKVGKLITKLYKLSYLKDNQEVESDKIYEMVTYLSGHWTDKVPETKYAEHPYQPAHLNYMHYAKPVSGTNKVEYYALINPREDSNMFTDAQFDTRIYNGSNISYEIYDVGNPGTTLSNIKNYFKDQTVGSYINGWAPISKNEDRSDAIIQKLNSKPEVEFKIPKSRFGPDGRWKFLVKITADRIDNQEPVRFESFLWNYDLQRQVRDTVLDKSDGLVGTLIHEYNKDIFELEPGSSDRFNISVGGGDKSYYTTKLRLKDGIRPGQYIADTNVRLTFDNNRRFIETREVSDDKHIRLEYQETPINKPVNEPTPGVINVVNTRELGKFKINKVDGEGKPLENAGFTLYKEKDNDNSIIGEEVFTNSNGEIYYWNVPFGTYFLKETTVPEGYSPKDGIWTEVTIDKNFTSAVNDSDIIVDPTDPTDPKDSTDPVDPEYPVPTPTPQPTPVLKSKILSNNTVGNIKNNFGDKLSDIRASLNPIGSSEFVTDYELTLTFSPEDLYDISYEKTNSYDSVDLLFLVENDSNIDSFNDYNLNVGKLLTNLKGRENTARVGVISYNQGGISKQLPLTPVNNINENQLKVSKGSAGGTKTQINTAMSEAKTIMQASNAKKKIVVIVSSGKNVVLNNAASNTNLKSVAEVYAYVKNESAYDTAYYAKNDASGIRITTDLNHLVKGNNGWFDKVESQINEAVSTTTKEVKTPKPAINGQTISIKSNPYFEINGDYKFTLPKLSNGQSHEIKTMVRFLGENIGKYDVIDNISFANGNVYISSPSIEIYEDDSQPSSLISNRSISTTDSNRYIGLYNSVNNIVKSITPVRTDNIMELLNIMVDRGVDFLDTSIEGIKMTSDISLIPKDEDFNNYSFTIKNYKKGNGSINLLKRGENNDILHGVTFELLSFDKEDVIKSETTNENGKIEFTGLDYGRYWLREVKTLDGYEVDDELIPVSVTKNYPIPENYKGEDVSNRLSVFSKSIKSTTNSKEEVYPNDAEGLFADITLQVNQNNENRIYPGDSFNIKLSDNLDLDGIGKSKTIDTGRYDIYGPYGTLAKAEIQDDKKTIKYTFTEYLKDSTLGNEINLTIPVFVDRFKVPNNTTETFGFKLGDNLTEFDKKIAVKYFDKYNKQTEPYINGLPVKIDHDTKEFRILMYLNMNREWTSNKKYYFTPGLDVENLMIKAYRFDWGDLPHSYGIDLSGKNYIYHDYGEVNAGDEVWMDVAKNVNNNSYVVEVTGKINSNEPKTMTTRSWYYANIGDTQNYRNYYWDTETKFYGPSGRADASPSENEDEIVVYNHKNSVEYTKIGITLENKNSIDDLIKLAGATLELRKLGNNNKYETVEGTSITTKEDGIIRWEGIPTGEYEVWETEAPSGYTKPLKAVAKFIVDENGKITKFDDKGKETTQPYIENYSVNYPYTGGPGENILFLTVGAMVMAFGAFYYNKKRRKSY